MQRRKENGVAGSSVVDLDPYGSLAVNDIVRSVAFCHHEWNSSLLAVGTESQVTIFSCKFPEEDTDLEEMSVEVVKTFNHGCPVRAFSWSPNMSLVMNPVWIRFVTAGGDKCIRIFHSDLKTDHSVNAIDGHTGYVNDVAFEPQSGETIASVSDDHTCRIWGLDGALKGRLSLRSPGMRVCWHPEEPGKLMVAEKNGTIRFYNALTLQSLMCLESNKTPLLSADWSLKNSDLVGCVASGSWFVWSCAVSSHSGDHKVVHSDGATEFRLACSSPFLCATRGYPGNQVKVLNLKAKNQVLMKGDYPVGCGISWHLKFPVIAVGGDSRVYIWKVSSI